MDSFFFQDYVMVITAEQFTPNIVGVNPVDKSAEFISSCGQEDFYIELVSRGGVGLD